MIRMFEKDGLPGPDPPDEMSVNQLVPVGSTGVRGDTQ